MLDGQLSQSAIAGALSDRELRPEAQSNGNAMPPKNLPDAALADHRRELILATLSSGGQCRVSDLARKFSLSEMTVRRDLHVLEEQGLLRRVHGGAVLVDAEVEYPLRA